jgi:hypothetical protein
MYKTKHLSEKAPYIQGGKNEFCYLTILEWSIGKSFLSK